MAKNRVIGVDGKLPWQLPEDLQRFKQLTMGQTLLMGRKTYESIGRQLPGRETIVLSRDLGFQAEGCVVVADLQAGIDTAQTEELFICGGGEIYRQALPLAQRIYLTEVQREVGGDTCFPDIPVGQFRVVKQEIISGKEPCQFSIFERMF